MYDRAIGRHYVNAPSHAATIVDCLYGHFAALRNLEEQDPLLYAYAVKDRIKAIAGLVIELEKWTVAVIDSTPDQIQETGAQLCH